LYLFALLNDLILILRFRALVKYNKEMYNNLSDLNIESELERYRVITFFMFLKSQ